MHTARRIALAWSVAGVVSLPAGAAEVDLRAAILANPCAGCHGMDGKSPGSIPSFYQLSPDAIVAALKAFKSGERPSTVMGRIAKGYTDEEIQRIADYFKALPPATKQ
jgi:sulfide dehydrogenase cytochrome subunit